MGEKRGVEDEPIVCSTLSSFAYLTGLRTHAWKSSVRSLPCASRIQSSSVEFESCGCVRRTTGMVLRLTVLPLPPDCFNCSARRSAANCTPVVSARFESMTTTSNRFPSRIHCIAFSPLDVGLGTTPHRFIIPHKARKHTTLSSTTSTRERSNMGLELSESV